MSDKKYLDAMGNPIEIGQLYGYTSGSSSLTIVTGIAQKITPTGKVSLKIESYKRSYYGREASDYPYSAKSISQVPIRMFPISKSSTNEERSENKGSKEYRQIKNVGWLDTPKGTIYIKTDFENYIQPKDKSLRTTMMGVDLDLLFGNDEEVFELIK